MILVLLGMQPTTSIDGLRIGISPSKNETACQLGPETNDKLLNTS